MLLPRLLFMRSDWRLNGSEAKSVQPVAPKLAWLLEGKES